MWMRVVDRRFVIEDYLNRCFMRSDATLYRRLTKSAVPCVEDALLDKRLLATELLATIKNLV